MEQLGYTDERALDEEMGERGWVPRAGPVLCPCARGRVPIVEWRRRLPWCTSVEADLKLSQ